ncbi:MAG: biotin/lipoyl-containing protein [Pseudomonadota bacterium]
MTVEYLYKDNKASISLLGDVNGRRRFCVDGKIVDLDIRQHSETGGGRTVEFDVVVGGKPVSVVGVLDDDVVWVHALGATRKIQIAKDSLQADKQGASTGDVRAPMPGIVVEVTAKAGDEVKAGSVVMVIESMKLQSTLTSEIDGVLDTVPFETGEAFQKGDTLFSVKSSA